MSSLFFIFPLIGATTLPDLADTTPCTPKPGQHFVIRAAWTTEVDHSNKDHISYHITESLCIAHDNDWFEWRYILLKPCDTGLSSPQWLYMPEEPPIKHTPDDDGHVLKFVCNATSTSHIDVHSFVLHFDKFYPHSKQASVYLQKPKPGADYKWTFHKADVSPFGHHIIARNNQGKKIHLGARLESWNGDKTLKVVAGTHENSTLTWDFFCRPPHHEACANTRMEDEVSVNYLKTTTKCDKKRIREAFMDELERNKATKTMRTITTMSPLCDYPGLELFEHCPIVCKEDHHPLKSPPGEDTSVEGYAKCLPTHLGDIHIQLPTCTECREDNQCSYDGDKPRCDVATKTCIKEGGCSAMEIWEKMKLRLPASDGSYELYNRDPMHSVVSKCLHMGLVAVAASSNRRVRQRSKSRDKCTLSCAPHAPPMMKRKRPGSIKCVVDEYGRPNVKVRLPKCQGWLQIIGEAKQGHILTARPPLSAEKGQGNYTYRWKCNNTDIADMSSSSSTSSLTLDEDHVGCMISVSLMYTDVHGNEDKASLSSSEAKGPVEK